MSKPYITLPEDYAALPNHLPDSVEVCEWSEVKKLIRAFQDKYNDPGCEGLPYEPKTMKIKLFGVKE